MPCRCSFGVLSSRSARFLDVVSDSLESQSEPPELTSEVGPNAAEASARGLFLSKADSQASFNKGAGPKQAWRAGLCSDSKRSKLKVPI